MIQDIFPEDWKNSNLFQYPHTKRAFTNKKGHCLINLDSDPVIREKFYEKIWNPRYLSIFWQLQ